MQNSIDATIAELRSASGVSSNAELARRLGIEQSTISAWRARGRVPERYVNLLQKPTSENAAKPPQIRGEIEGFGQALALARFTLLRSEIAFSKDVDRAISVFRDLKPFWVMMNRAIHELRLKMETLSVDLVTAQALLIQEDMRDPDAALLRIADQLAEDFRDNPNLQNWK